MEDRVDEIAPCDLRKMRKLFLDMAQQVVIALQRSNASIASDSFWSPAFKRAWMANIEASKTTSVVFLDKGPAACVQLLALRPFPPSDESDNESDNESIASNASVNFDGALAQHGMQQDDDLNPAEQAMMQQIQQEMEEEDEEQLLCQLLMVGC